jgi:hypothetical protein
MDQKRGVFKYLLKNKEENFSWSFSGLKDEVESNTMDVDMEENSAMSIDQFELEKNFIAKMDKIFTQFMQIETNVKLAQHEFTLERLAIYLETLHKLSSARSFVRRIPGYLSNRGRPNLITCKQIEQIQIVLSIYSFDKNESLPTNDEILYCSSETTSEEVENFFRIAFKSTGTRIYTILNLQELRYENSAQIERFLSSNTRLQQTDDYILVCVCTSDNRNENSSLIESLLNRNKITPILLPMESIEAYLAAKFKNPNGLARNDPDGSFVRALVSQKAGNGKSTYCKSFVSATGVRADSVRTIRIKSFKINIDEEFLKLRRSSASQPGVVYHIDIANEVFHNVDLFLFNLTILGYLKHSNGQIWRRRACDMHFIEIMPLYLTRNQSFHSVVNFLPKIVFRTPSKYLYDLCNLDTRALNLLNDNLFNNFYLDLKFQRPAAYLKLAHENPNNLGMFYFRDSSVLTQVELLRILLEQSKLTQPSWAELNNFVYFLDEQLEVMEKAGKNKVNSYFIKSAEFLLLLLLLSRDNQ